MSFRHRQEDGLPSETACVNPEGFMLPEVSGAETDKYCIDLTYVCHQKDVTSKKQSRLVVGGGGQCVEVANRYKLPVNS